MAMDDDGDRRAQRSHLFILRLWLEDLGNGQTDRRGKVQHVNSGEVRYFRDWQTLEAFVEGLTLNVNPEENRADGMEDTERGSP